MIRLIPLSRQNSHLLAGTSYAALQGTDLQTMLRQSCEQNYQGQFFEILLILDSQTPVGVISLFGQGNSISCGPEIKPEYRQRGYAYAAALLALEHARSLGFSVSGSQVRRDNAASIALHKKLGFTVTKEYENAKGKPVYWFEKAL